MASRALLLLPREQLTTVCLMCAEVRSSFPPWQEVCPTRMEVLVLSHWSLTDRVRAMSGPHWNFYHLTRERTRRPFWLFDHDGTHDLGCRLRIHEGVQSGLLISARHRRHRRDSIVQQCPTMPLMR